MYYNSFPAEERKKYMEIYRMLFVEKFSLTYIQKASGIRHDLLQRCRKFLVERKIVQ
jgi:hypothetical protein